MSDSFDRDFGDISEAVRRAIEEAQNQGFVTVVVSGLLVSFGGRQLRRCLVRLGKIYIKVSVNDTD